MYLNYRGTKPPKINYKSFRNLISDHEWQVCRRVYWFTINVSARGQLTDDATIMSESSGTFIAGWYELGNGYRLSICESGIWYLSDAQDLVLMTCEDL